MKIGPHPNPADAAEGMVWLETENGNYETYETFYAGMASYFYYHTDDDVRAVAVRLGANTYVDSDGVAHGKFWSGDPTMANLNRVELLFVLAEIGPSQGIEI